MTLFSEAREWQPELLVVRVLADSCPSTQLSKEKTQWNSSKFDLNEENPKENIETCQIEKKTPQTRIKCRTLMMMLAESDGDVSGTFIWHPKQIGYF